MTPVGHPSSPRVGARALSRSRRQSFAQHAPLASLLGAETASELDAFMGRHPRLWDPMWAEALSEIVLWEAVRPRLSGDAVTIGDAQVVWLLDAVTGDVERHGALLIRERFVVDLTRRAIDPDAVVPYVYRSFEDLGRHWRGFVRGDRADSLPVAPPAPGVQTSAAGSRAA